MQRLPLGVRFAAVAMLTLAAASPLPSAAKAPPQTRASRLDPYKNYKFQLQVDGRTVAGMNSVIMPVAVKPRSGGDPSTSHKPPGRTKYEAITLERGVTQDTDFATWAASGAKRQGASARTVRIVAMDGGASYTIQHAWVSEYRTTSKLGADGNPIAIEHIKLENEGWERD